MITRETGRERDAHHEATVAKAVWQARVRALSTSVDLLCDAPSQMLAGVKAWRLMTVDPRTGEERRPRSGRGTR